MELYDYQKSLINQMRFGLQNAGSVCVQLQTGGGKSVMIGWLVKKMAENNKRVIVMAHRRELVTQLTKTFREFGSDVGVIAAGLDENPKALIQVCMVQTLINRLDKIEAPQYIITDECFVAGTLVDGVPIENVSVGDFVFSFNEKTGRVSKNKVLNVFMRPVSGKKLYKITTNVGSVICTEEHPFFTDSGWVNAGGLNEKTKILSNNKNKMPKVRWGNASKVQNVQELLCQNNYFTQSNRGTEEDARKQSNEEACSEKKNGKNIKKDWSRPVGSWRKWAWPYCSSAKIICAIVSTWRWLGFRVCRENWKFEKTIQGPVSLFNKKTRTGREENNCLEFVGVESVEVFERVYIGKHARMCKEDYVYNLEVENDNTYFANGFVVHNCHRVMGATYLSIHKKFPAAKSIGFSATPTRLEGRGLKDVYKSIVQGPSTKWLIENKFLSPFKIYAPKNFLDLSKIKTVMGEYEKGKLEAEVMRPQVIGNVAHEYIKLAHKKRTIMFAASIKHSHALVAQLQMHNIRAVHLDADSDKPLRAGALEMLANGEVDVISNVGLFSEGLDIKAVECVIDAAPTQSLVNYLQRCGRALRVHPDKTHAIIIDMAGNCFRFGMPNEPRTWTLEDLPKRKKGKSQNLEPVRVCQNCYAANSQAATQCSECGHKFPIQSRQVEEKEGELSEVTEIQKKAKQLQKKKEQAECKTLEDLIALGESRGYGNPAAWANFVYSGRSYRG